MDSIISNWKTSVAGIVLIGVGALSLALGIHIPGFSMDPGAAIAAGLGLLMAKDSA